MDIVEAHSLLVEIRDNVLALRRRMEELDSPPRAITKQAACKMLSIGETTLRAMIADGALHTVTIGAREMIPFSEIVRVTSVVSTTKRKAPTLPTPKLPKRGRAGSHNAKAEAERTRALLRREVRGH